MAHAAHKDAFVELARSNGYTRYTLYELNLLGDPETRIWTRNPVSSTVMHASEIPLGEHELLVTVSRDGEAGPDAMVFLATSEWSISATTGPDGIATLTK